MIYDASSSKVSKEVASSQKKLPKVEVSEIPHAITKLSTLGIGEYDIDDVIFNIPTA